MARRYRPRSRFVVPLLIALIGLALYYTDDIDQSTVLTPKLAENEPTAFAEGARMIEYDEQGKPKIDVRSARSYYFDGDELILSEQPEVHFTNEGGDHSVLKAQRGEYKPSAQTLQLHDKVVVHRVNAAGDRLTLKTEDLHVDISKNFISTSREVNIDQNRHKLSSLGIKASLNDKKIELPARVRGIYDLSE